MFLSILVIFLVFFPFYLPLSAFVGLFLLEDVFVDKWFSSSKENISFIDLYDFWESLPPDAYALLQPEEFSLERELFC